MKVLLLALAALLSLASSVPLDTLTTSALLDEEVSVIPRTPSTQPSNPMLSSFIAIDQIPIVGGSKELTMEQVSKESESFHKSLLKSFSTFGVQGFMKRLVVTGLEKFVADKLSKKEKTLKSVENAMKKKAVEAVRFPLGDSIPVAVMQNIFMGAFCTNSTANAEKCPRMTKIKVDVGVDSEKEEISLGLFQVQSKRSNGDVVNQLVIALQSYIPFESNFNLFSLVAEYTQTVSRFYEIAEKLYKALNDFINTDAMIAGGGKIKDLISTNQIVFVGYGSGGSIASIVALKFAASSIYAGMAGPRNSFNKFVTISIASPRVFSSGFANPSTYPLQTRNHLQFICDADLHANSPIDSKLVHAGILYKTSWYSHIAAYAKSFKLPKVNLNEMFAKHASLDFESMVEAVSASAELAKLKEIASLIVTGIQTDTLSVIELVVTLMAEIVRNFNSYFTPAMQTYAQRRMALPSLSPKAASIALEQVLSSAAGVKEIKFSCYQSATDLSKTSKGDDLSSLFNCDVLVQGKKVCTLQYLVYLGRDKEAVPQQLMNACSLNSSPLIKTSQFDVCLADLGESTKSLQDVIFPNGSKCTMPLVQSLSDSIVFRNISSSDQLLAFLSASPVAFYAMIKASLKAMPMSCTPYLKPLASVTPNEDISSQVSSFLMDLTASANSDCSNLFKNFESTQFSILSIYSKISFTDAAMREAIEAMAKHIKGNAKYFECSSKQVFNPFYCPAACSASADPSFLCGRLTSLRLDSDLMRIVVGYRGDSLLSYGNDAKVQAFVEASKDNIIAFKVQSKKGFGWFSTRSTFYVTIYFPVELSK